MIPAIPLIKVTFVFLVDGKEQRRYQIWCPAIPREDEIVRPEHGSKQMIVHSVSHYVEQIGVSEPTMIPVVFLRDLTQEEQAKYLFPEKK
jgi:hypothetical protein